MNLILAVFLFRAGFGDPQIPDAENLVYRGYDDGNKTSREVTHKVYDKGDYYYSTHEHLDTTRIIVKCKIRKSDLSTMQVVKDRSGRFQLSVEPCSGGLLVKDASKSKEVKINHSGVFYDRHTLLDVFRGFPFENPQKIEFPLFESNVGTVITGTCIYGGIQNDPTIVMRVSFPESVVDPNRFADLFSGRGMGNQVARHNALFQITVYRRYFLLP